MSQRKSEWPQSLKDFANRVFQAAANQSNYQQVQAELKEVIYKAFEANAIHTTNWDQVQLKSLGGHQSALAGPSSSPAGSSPATGKKGKKRLLTGSNNGDSEEDNRRDQRAKRFQREQSKFEQEREQGWSDAVASTSLAGRFGQQTLDKRKAGSRSSYGQPDSPGWTYDVTPSALQDRWSRPSTGGSLLGARGFDEEIADPNVIDWDRDTVVGLSTKLEKSYLRLTSAPDPKTVRPLPVLKETLELLKKKWRAESNYAYICDQFKSVRQDLTVQRIKNDFTVKVYEIHARIALEKGDLGEYNQCQSQLRTLYAYGLPGSQMEFLAYRILYLLHTQNRREVNALMSELTSAHKASPAVAHALDVRLTLATGNYHRFFKLYSEPGSNTNMNAYILDHFVERERVVALSVIAKSYRPSIPLPYLSSELAFADLQEAHDFLDSHKIAVYIEPTPAEAAAAITKSSSSQSGRDKKKKSNRSTAELPVAVIPLEERKWDCKNALPGVIAAGEKYRKIDIKGQI